MGAVELLGGCAGAAALGARRGASAAGKGIMDTGTGGGGCAATGICKPCESKVDKLPDITMLSSTV